MFVINWYMAVVIGAFLLYGWMYWTYSYWSRRGVQGPTPVFIFGNTSDLFVKRLCLSETFLNIYNKSKHLAYAGIYTMFKKTLMINDLDLIKSFLLKDFTHFHDRGIQVDEARDPLLMHLFNLKGEMWKNLRNKLTPTFTSFKMRYMFSTLTQCNVEMMHHLKDKLEDGGICILNTKELFACLNTDIIGSCAFGIECNSFKYPDAEFRTMGRKFVNPGVCQFIQRMCVLFAPNLARAFDLRFMTKQQTDYFYNIVVKTIEHREVKGIVRNDFLQLLMELHREEVDTITTGGDDGTTAGSEEVNSKLRCLAYHLIDVLDCVA